MDYFIWFVLLIIAISDAKEHRIPNSFLIATLLLCIINIAIYPDTSPSWGAALTGLVVMFLGALCLHVLRVMAPGDVKLLGVIGFWLGWGELGQVCIWIAGTTILVGTIYALVKFAGKESEMLEQVSKYKLLFAYGRSGTKALGEHKSEKLRMPFAPIVVIGVALHNYF